MGLPARETEPFGNRKEVQDLKNYEAAYIIDAAIEEEGADQLVETINNQITGNGGTIAEVDIWGRKKLAYEIKKRNEGIYVITRFQGESGIANKLMHFLKINDKILKYLVILLEE